MEFSTDPNVYPTTVGVYRLPLKILRSEHMHNDYMQQRVDDLERVGFSHWRKARGDGNWYYRALAVGLVESTMRCQGLEDFSREILNTRLFPQPWACDGQETVYMEMQSLLIGLHCSGGFHLQLAYFNQRIQNQELDKTLVMFIRYLAASFLETYHHLPYIAPYLFQSVEEKVENILTMGEEANGITFSLVANALSLVVTHYSTHDHTLGVDRFEPFSPQIRNIEVNLLLRPGHYDLLYLSEEIKEDKYVFKDAKFGNIAYAQPPMKKQVKIDLEKFQEQVRLFFPDAQMQILEVVRGSQNFSDCYVTVQFGSEFRVQTSKAPEDIGYGFQLRKNSFYYGFFVNNIRNGDFNTYIFKDVQSKENVFIQQGTMENDLLHGEIDILQNGQVYKFQYRQGQCMTISWQQEGYSFLQDNKSSELCLVTLSGKSVMGEIYCNKFFPKNGLKQYLKLHRKLN